ncbi:MAG: vanadium-dependent haloperoxidase [Verrucomicrobiales bacterium]
MQYHYRFWRPIQAIPRAAEDTNAATEADPAWQALLEAPPHPEYPSGHSTFTGAGCAVLEHFLGKGETPFEIGSDSLAGATRRYRSVRQCADEIGRSRIYGGIHFQFSNAQGKALGERVAVEALEAIVLQRSAH